jgi:hypothetical protein
MMVKPLYSGSSNKFRCLDPGGQIGIGQKWGLALITASPTKTIFSSGKMTQIAPEVGPGMTLKNNRSLVPI